MPDHYQLITCFKHPLPEAVAVCGDQRGGQVVPKLAVSSEELTTPAANWTFVALGHRNGTRPTTSSPTPVVRIKRNGSLKSDPFEHGKHPAMEAGLRWLPYPTFSAFFP
jgi:hypothetical protein